MYVAGDDTQSTPRSSLHLDRFRGLAPHVAYVNSVT